MGYPEMLGSWNASINPDPCNGWDYITCDEDGLVTTFNTGGASLGSVPVPSLLALLTNLQNVVLLSAGLVGPLPDTWGMLQNILILDLSNNAVTGNIPPEWEPLADGAVIIDLRSTDLCGAVPNGPAWSSALVRTTDTNIGAACPSPPPPSPPSPPSPPFPPVLVQALLLESISEEMGYPEMLGSWNATTNPDPCNGWEYITCDEDGLVTSFNTGGVSLGSVPVPSLLGLLTTLENVVLPSAGLVGPLPTTWGMLINIEILDLFNNAVTGIIPPEWGPLADDVIYINLQNTELCGSVPNSPAWSSASVMISDTDIGTACPSPPPSTIPPPPGSSQPTPGGADPDRVVLGFTDLNVGEQSRSQMEEWGLQRAPQPELAAPVDSCALVDASENKRICFSDVVVDGILVNSRFAPWPFSSTFYTGFFGTVYTTSREEYNLDQQPSVLVIDLPVDTTAVSFYASGLGTPNNGRWQLSATAMTTMAESVELEQIDSSPRDKAEDNAPFFGKFYGFATIGNATISTIMLEWTNADQVATTKGFIVGDFFWSNRVVAAGP
eukprot:349801-Chlamydomonas_euryale.AAC.35